MTRIIVNQENKNQYLIIIETDGHIKDNFLIKSEGLKAQIANRAHYYMGKGQSVQVVHNGVYNVKAA